MFACFTLNDEVQQTYIIDNENLFHVWNLNSFRIYDVMPVLEHSKKETSLYANEETSYMLIW